MKRFTMFAMSAVMVLGLGCSMFNPGGQVREALSQHKVYEWTDSGSFRVEGTGPQTERFLMLQGEIVMVLDAEGQEVVDWANSKIAYYLRADPSATEAADATTSAFAMAARQTEVAMKMMSQAFSMLIPKVSEQPPSETVELGTP